MDRRRCRAGKIRIRFLEQGVRLRLPPPSWGCCYTSLLLSPSTRSRLRRASRRSHCLRWLGVLLGYRRASTLSQLRLRASCPLCRRWRRWRLAQSRQRYLSRVVVQVAEQLLWWPSVTAAVITISCSPTSRGHHVKLSRFAQAVRRQTHFLSNLPHDGGAKSIGDPLAVDASLGCSLNVLLVIVQKDDLICRDIVPLGQRSQLSVLVAKGA
mmetsp:Transcript_63248/g.137578  ORF Transcript_63248/g.137578 Transcript_63248/m.137578 type:complete len:211 (+) Transcript_63248:139-771(+)